MKQPHGFCQCSYLFIYVVSLDAPNIWHPALKTRPNFAHQRRGRDFNLSVRPVCKNNKMGKRKQSQSPLGKKNNTNSLTFSLNRRSLAVLAGFAVMDTAFNCQLPPFTLSAIQFPEKGCWQPSHLRLTACPYQGGS